MSVDMDGAQIESVEAGDRRELGEAAGGGSAPRRAAVVVIVAAILLTAWVYWWAAHGSLVEREPVLGLPVPLPLLVLARPGVSMGVSMALVLSIPAVAFCAWCSDCLMGMLVKRRRSMALFAVVLVASLGFHGRAYLQPERDAGLPWSTLLSASFAILIGALSLDRNGRGSFARNVMMNFLLFAWMFTCAFPVHDAGR